VRKWFAKGQHSIGIICGDVSGGLTVIDFDSEELYHRWAADNPDLAATLPTAKTGRGFHVNGRTDLTKTKHLDGIDIKATGCVVAPPSVHQSGARYCWTVPLNGQPLPQIDLEKAQLDTRDTRDTEKPKTHKKHRDTQTIKGCGVGGGDDVVAAAIQETLPEREGQRNKRLFLLAVRLRGMFEGIDEARPVVEAWHKAALPMIGTEPFEITWLEFRRAWQKVKHPAGSGELGQAIQAARERLASGQSVHQADFESDEVRLLLETCLVLSDAGMDGTFFLSCRSAGKIIGQSQQTGAAMLQSFCEFGYLDVVCKGSAKGRQSTVYRWKGGR
jgi:hypothetical protein